jgi:hypothetical protein
MKKLLTGCLIVAVIAVVGLGVAGFYAYRIAKPVLQNAGDYVARAREISQLGDRLTYKGPYEAPANNELTPTQVERFLAVQARVRGDLGAKWDEIAAKSAELKKKTDGNQHLSLSEVTGLFQDVANIYTDARRAQVVALNTQRFSQAEYDWVRHRVWEAAGVQVAQGIDMNALTELAKQGGLDKTIEAKDVPMPDVPAKNIALIQPHLAKLKDLIPLALLGL